MIWRMAASHHLAHGHAHGHAQMPDGGAPTAELGARRRRALWWSVGLNGALFVLEIAGGLAFHSLALLADGAHLLTDVVGLGLALVAERLAARPATDRHTYGWQRAEVLAGLANGVILIVASCAIAWEAISRLAHPVDVAGLGVIVVASAGLAANLISAALLRRVMGRSMNVRAAWLHMVADALGSVAAILSGVAVLVWQAHWADPVASLVVTGLLLAATWGLLRDAVQVLLEGVPSDLTPAAITEALRADPAVADVHHLHVWALTQESSALSAHVVLRGTPSLSEAQVDGARLKHLLADRFGVHHSTLELEGQACDDG